MTGREPSVAAQVLDWCARTPDAIAVSQGERRWTYRELGQAVGGVAAELQAAGVRPGQVVAVTAHRGVAQAAAWVAVLLHRGVLLPLDPALPPAARTGMLTRAGARVDLLAGNVDAPAHPDVPVLRVCGQPRVSRRRVGPAADPGPVEAGYVFFTSGSTGVPKAILGRHRSLAAFLTWLRSALGVTPADRIAHLSGPGFDVSLREVFLPLTSGARLCLPLPGPVPPGAVLPWLAESGVTLVHTIPTVARAWLRFAPTGVHLPRLRTVLFSGEPLTDTLITRWRTQLGYQGVIVTQYGPTETTLIRCWHPVDRPVPGIQPLGRPIPGSEAWIEDPPGVPAPAGAVGEIVIRTAYGTSGYLGEEALTAGRFTFGPDGEVTYRTGDLGSVDEHGLLHFHGRTDDQIKIHGVRFHLHGVEAALEAQPGIDQAAVTAEPGVDGSPPRLTAHLLLSVGHDRIPVGLRAALLDHLPAAAVPSRLLVVDALPRTLASGKLDRPRLTTPTPSEPHGIRPAASHPKDTL
ncbi:AMP-binding protein [Streptomyces sp. NBC_01433]|uniref:AMP-binding protein n=1 Tax=Streptomyces sp. NBC_01433 TaxID=2903864 RepID=UPI00225178E6|nr:AMP-binding protein [Streptomyces sp. NBC_01433]MCX4682187.1 AMP-binding protein [Streptomyces sp. NBC_01433]